MRTSLFVDISKRRNFIIILHDPNYYYILQYWVYSGAMSKNYAANFSFKNKPKSFCSFNETLIYMIFELFRDILIYF